MRFFLTRDNAPIPEDNQPRPSDYDDYHLFVGARPKKYNDPSGRWRSHECGEGSWCLEVWSRSNFPFKDIELEPGQCVEVEIGSLRKTKNKRHRKGSR